MEEVRARGCDVRTAQEAGTLGQHDDEQLAYAASIGRASLSYNRGGFRRWHRQFAQTGQRHLGIVLLPQASPLARRVIRACMLLDWLAVLGQDVTRLLNWNDLQRRLQAGYRLPGYSEHKVLVALGRANSGSTHAGT